jgi:hypothetical protein
MGGVRFLIAVLMALSLAAAPVSASVPKPQGAAHQTQHMSTGAPDDCPCCDMNHGQAADACPLKCCSLAAILVEGQALTAPRPKPDVDIPAAGLSPFSPQPDPPPPRS